MTTTHKHRHLIKGKHGNIKLVLTQDVQHLGRHGEVVEVRPGYARNYLLPQGLATLPTEHNLRLVELHKERVHLAREAKVADLRVLAEQIQRVPHITIEAAANEEGHLYGSVGAPEISRALKGKNLKVEPEMVQLDGVIKECGIYEAIPLNLGYETTATVKVMVVPQKQAEKK